jgi:hypothetical protein
MTAAGKAAALVETVCFGGLTIRIEEPLTLQECARIAKAWHDLHNDPRQLSTYHSKTVPVQKTGDFQLLRAAGESEAKWIAGKIITAADSTAAELRCPACGQPLPSHTN